MLEVFATNSAAELRTSKIAHSESLSRECFGEGHHLTLDSSAPHRSKWAQNDGLFVSKNELETKGRAIRQEEPSQEFSLIE
jgi:hypothetical protein